MKEISSKKRYPHFWPSKVGSSKNEHPSNAYDPLCHCRILFFSNNKDLCKNKAFVRLVSSNNANLQIWQLVKASNIKTGPSSWSVLLVRLAGSSSWSLHLVRLSGLYTKLQYCKVAISCQKLPKVAKSCQMLPKVAKSLQKMAKVAKKLP